MEIVLVPGLWLDGSTWSEVASVLHGAGHHPHPVTLPGMESVAADRADVTLADTVEAVVRTIDTAAGAGGDGVVLVGHSAGCGIAYAALDARPDLVRQMFYVGGFPTPEGDCVADGFAVEHGEITLPAWTEFDEADLTDLDDPARDAFRARAVPSPGHLATDPQRLTDPRRLAVPATAVCSEYTSTMLRQWIGDGEQPVREFTRLSDLSYVDLPTGHWPQFTRPVDLAEIIMRS